MITSQSTLTALNEIWCDKKIDTTLDHWFFRNDDDGPACRVASRRLGIGYCTEGPVPMIGNIIIPIRDKNDSLVAYQSQTPGCGVDEERKKFYYPKGFDKTKVIYNLSNAFCALRQQPLVIVEDSFEVLELTRMGINKCVALFGDSLSDVQESLLAEYLGCFRQPRVAVLFGRDMQDKEKHSAGLRIVDRLRSIAEARLLSWVDAWRAGYDEVLLK